jgi:hypothetical protein
MSRKTTSIWNGIAWAFVRWMEALGQCASPARDPGIDAWHYLLTRPAEGPEGPRRPPARPTVDDPHLSICIGT